MSPNLFHLVTLFLAFSLFSLANAALYVVTPRDQSTCRGGEPCTVTWLDDGRAPLLTAIGVSTIGLYTGQKKIVQTLPPVDVSANLSFVFTPDPDAGPNSDSYYLAFTSTQAKNGTGFYEAFSPWFSLEGMKGSFDSPDPSATKSIPIPSTLSNKPTTSTTMTTITVGTLVFFIFLIYFHFHHYASDRHLHHTLVDFIHFSRIIKYECPS
ncbi:hypothetical protein D9611_008486 [Ephemerocybe angulata]|uniref:Yeast cell wall synthesis Kre9/Knh1-like N-terminal domain-containing protein n=1 Tax=Ephemerocybe angulata TaxID=980116 RepID=A0A8H5EUW2_9AGAR|nr:hypothetical protein D9611_008486 [Tulosesus angulatus]